MHFCSFLSQREMKVFSSTVFKQNEEICHNLIIEEKPKRTIGKQSGDKTGVKRNTSLPTKAQSIAIIRNAERLSEIFGN